MIPVEEAQARLLALRNALPSVLMTLDQAIGHYLAEDIVARRTQPAADLSAMDGYAIRYADLPGPFTQIGESAAGAPFNGSVDCKQAVRIFTGAHVPAGSDTILVQEDAHADGNQICLTGNGPNMAGKHIRRQGGDFRSGDLLASAGSRLHSGTIAAAAMAGYGRLSVGGTPRVKIVSTGDELLPPGEICDAAHIPSSNNIMLQAMLKPFACQVVDAGIIKDDLDLITAAFDNAEDFDIIVTSGGASVGDRDFVQDALRAAGAEIDFWRVAMRPGKPLMSGRIGNTIVLGLPGNPSSAFVTATLFLLPLVRHLASSNAALPKVDYAPVSEELPAGDKRTEYMRALFEHGIITPFNKQDSGMITPLVSANALLIRPAFAPPLKTGDATPYLALNQN